MNSNAKLANRAPVALSAAMLLACVGVVSSVFADDQVRSEIVKFPDLNVSTPAGAEALYVRIHSAARRVCSQTETLLQVSAVACAKKAEAEAIAKFANVDFHRVEDLIWLRRYCSNAAARREPSELPAARHHAAAARPGIH